LAVLPAILLAGLIATGTPAQAPQSPPIFQPGAPGAAARVITPAEAVALGRSTFTADDVAFMQHMIVHHAQAVEMVGLLEARGSSPSVRMLGRRIALSQQAEMTLMRDWLTERGQPLEMAGMSHAGMDHSAHAGHGAGHAMPASDTPIMPGMLSPAQMPAPPPPQRPAFHRPFPPGRHQHPPGAAPQLFLQGMIQHHQGAIDMVADLLAHPGAAEDTLLSDFTISVVSDQSTEILRMQSILEDL